MRSPTRSTVVAPTSTVIEPLATTAADPPAEVEPANGAVVAPDFVGVPPTSCTVPVIAAGRGISYLRRTEAGTTMVHDALDGSHETMPVGPDDLVDLAVTGGRALYIVAGDTAPSPGQLRRIDESGIELAGIVGVEGVRESWPPMTAGWRG